MASSHAVLPPVFVVERDFERLSALVDGDLADTFPDETDALRCELDRALVVDVDACEDVVTMHAGVEYLDVVTGRSARATIVYPWESDPTEGRVSVLAPVATALLGLRVGSTIEWTTRSGRRFTWRVLAIEGANDP